MKKITLFVALMCSFSAFSTRYLVEGTTGTNSWRIAGAGEVNVTLTTDFSSWYNATFPSGYTYNAADEIWLAGGTYTLSYAFGSRKVNVYGGFAGTETNIADRSKVPGGNAWDFSTPTILDGNNAIPQGFNSNGIATTPSTYIDGVTITKCKVNNVTANVYGVGAYITQGCVMQNCIVSNNTYNNTATANTFVGKGGGIYLLGGKVLDTYIVGNTLTKGNGGATYGGGIAFAYSGVAALDTVKGCTIENNWCSVYGGGIEIILGAGGDIENCIIKGNYATDRGAGLGYANIQSGTSNLSIRNCQFIGNTGATYGGGVALNFGASTGTTTFENNSIIGNTGSNAGGMYIGGGKFAPFKNCIFRDNKGGSYGALYCNIANATFQNCIFANNSSAATPGGNFTVGLLNLTNNMYNCTFANNNDPGTAGYTISFNYQAQTVTNNVFWGNTAIANFYLPNLSTSTYNATTSDKNTTGSAAATSNIITLTSSPNNTFISPTTFTGVPSTTDGGIQSAASAAADWSMLIGSPGVDAGTDLNVSGVTTDILGNARPLGSGFDMGAFERSSVATNINTVHDNILCYSVNNNIEVHGLNRNELVKVYSITGNLIYNQKTLNSSISISVPQGVYLVHTSDNVNKVVVR